MNRVRVCAYICQASQLAELVELVPKTFSDFNKSLTTNVHPSLFDEDFGDTALAPAVVERYAGVSIPILFYIQARFLSCLSTRKFSVQTSHIKPILRGPVSNNQCAVRRENV